MLILPTQLTNTVSTLEAGWLACSVSGSLLNALYLRRSVAEFRLVRGQRPSIIVAARGHRWRDAQRMVCQLCFVGAGLVAASLPNAPIVTWQGITITALLMIPEPLMVLAAIKDARDTLHMQRLESMFAHDQGTVRSRVRRSWRVWR